MKVISHLTLEDMELDRNDRKILSILQQDGRIANVELAERIFDKNLSAKTVMIIGAGKMGEACVRHFAKKGARSVLVSNRSFERAQNLATEFGGRAVRFDKQKPVRRGRRGAAALAARTK